MNKIYVTIHLKIGCYYIYIYLYYMKDGYLKDL